MDGRLILRATLLVLAVVPAAGNAQSSTSDSISAGRTTAPVRMAWLHRDVGLLMAELDPLTMPLWWVPEYRRELFEAAATEFLERRWPQLQSTWLRGERLAIRHAPVQEFVVVRVGNCTVVACNTVTRPRVVVERYEVKVSVDPRTNQAFVGAGPISRRLAASGATVLARLSLGWDVYNSYLDATRDRREGMDLGANLRYLEPLGGFGLGMAAPLLVNASIPLAGAIVLGGTAAFAGRTVMRAATEATHVMEANLRRAYLEGRTHFNIDEARARGLMGTAFDQVSLASTLGAEIVIAHAHRLAADIQTHANIRRHVILLREQGTSDEAIASTLDRFGVGVDEREMYLFEPSYPCRGCAWGAEIGTDPVPGRTVPASPRTLERVADERGGVYADIRVRAGDFRPDSATRRNRRSP
jgi:hypothetical protein